MEISTEITLTAKSVSVSKSSWKHDEPFVIRLPADGQVGPVVGEAILSEPSLRKLLEECEGLAKALDEEIVGKAKEIQAKEGLESL